MISETLENVWGKIYSSDHLLLTGLDLSLPYDPQGGHNTKATVRRPLKGCSQSDVKWTTLRRSNRERAHAVHPDHSQTKLSIW